MGMDPHWLYTLLQTIQELWHIKKQKKHALLTGLDCVSGFFHLCYTFSASCCLSHAIVAYRSFIYDVILLLPLCISVKMGQKYLWYWHHDVVVRNCTVGVDSFKKQLLWGDIFQFRLPLWAGWIRIIFLPLLSCYHVKLLSFYLWN